MNTAVMTSYSTFVPSLSRTKAEAKPGLSVRQWIGVFSSALAMADAIPQTGRVSAKQVEQMRALATAI